MQALWSLSEEQACDLMHLRRLSITRRVVLSMQRKALMAQLATSDSQILNPTESILTVEELTKALSQNAVEDRKIFYKVARAVHRGVSNLPQNNNVLPVAGARFGDDAAHLVSLLQCLSTMHCDSLKTCLSAVSLPAIP
jgi:hypothetical protein